MLTSWPILSDQRDTYLYRGDHPDSFLWDVLDPIGGKLQRRCDNGHLAEELLDPFIFAQLIAGIMGKYTINGTPFHSNWRMLPAALRMAKRLGADALARALEDVSNGFEQFDSKTLDAYDDNTILEHPDRDAVLSKLDPLFGALLQTPVDEGRCSYGQFHGNFKGGDALLSALSEWISDCMPRHVVDDRDTARRELEANHHWACEHVDGYYREWVAFYVGLEAYHLLEAAGLKFQRHRFNINPPKGNQVWARRLVARDDQELALFGFEDFDVLVDIETMSEIARYPLAKPRYRAPTAPPALRLADRPRLTFDPETLVVRKASLLGRFGKTLTYRQ